MAPNWVSLMGVFFDTGMSPSTGHEGRGVTALLPFKKFLFKKKNLEINSDHLLLLIVNCYLTVLPEGTSIYKSGNPRGLFLESKGF